MTAHPAPAVGALGFYGPNPGGPRSPNMVREVRGSIIAVREIVTGKVTEMATEEWWSARMMCTDTDRIIDDGNFDRKELAGRIRAMNDALACYAGIGSSTSAGTVDQGVHVGSLTFTPLDATPTTPLARFATQASDELALEDLRLTLPELQAIPRQTQAA